MSCTEGREYPMYICTLFMKCVDTCISAANIHVCSFSYHLHVTGANYGLLVSIVLHIQ